MKADRELDALIAERVFGWRRSDETGELCWHTPDMIFECGIPNLVNKLLPHYSTSIEAAWEVVEKLRQHCFRITVYSQPQQGLAVQVVNGGEGPYLSAEVYGNIDKCDTVPHAICLAALKALGVEI